MSSSDRDVSISVNTVPRMSDTTNKEKQYYKKHRLWGEYNYYDAFYVKERARCWLFCWRSWLLSPGTFSLLGLPVLMVGVGALVQGTKYIPPLQCSQLPP